MHDERTKQLNLQTWQVVLPDKGHSGRGRDTSPGAPRDRQTLYLGQKHWFHAHLAARVQQPSILGGPQIFLLAGVAYSEVTAKLNWPQGAALGYELLVMAILVAIVIVRFGRPKWQERT